MSRKCCKIAADLSQNSEFLFRFSFFSVQCGPGLIFQVLPAVNIVNITSCSLVCTSASNVWKSLCFYFQSRRYKSKFRQNQDRFKTFFNPTQK
jgi:hypothetical protein